MGAHGSLDQESSRRVADSAGKAVGYLLLAEEHLWDMKDVLGAMPTAGEECEKDAVRYVHALAEHVWTGRRHVIEISEQLLAKHQCEER
ncbi:hypothetical protein [Actinophytocola sp. KF-1]